MKERVLVIRIEERLHFARLIASYLIEICPSYPEVFRLEPAPFRPDICSSAMRLLTDQPI